jgi:hypothetical protein
MAEEAGALTDGGVEQEATLAGGGGRGAMSSGVRSGVAGSIGRRGVGRRGGRESWCRCRSGSMGSGGWHGVGRVGRADTRTVDQLSAWGSVDRLDHWIQVMNLWSITLGDE